MPRPMTAAVRTELGKAVPSPVFLVDLDLPSGAVRRSTHDYDLTHEGNVFTGGADLLDVGPVEETIDLVASGQRITLSGSPASLLGSILTDNFQGRDMKLWIGFLDSAGALIANAVLLFSGPLDQAEAIEGGEEAVIVITAENRLVDMHRDRDRRYTGEDQKQVYPDDLGLDYVESMQEKDIRWAGGLLPTLLRQGRIGGLFGVRLSSVANSFTMSTATIREPAASRRFVFGETRVGGTIVFAHRTGLDTIHVIVVLCDGPVEAIGDIYFNDEVVPLDANGDAQNATYTATTISAAASDDSFNDSAAGFPKLFKDDRIKVTGFSNGANNSAGRVGGVFIVDQATASKILIRFGGLVDEGAGPSVTVEDLSSYKDFATIKKHLGDPSQATDPDLLAAAPNEWTANHRLQGIAYIYAEIIMDEDRYADGLPNITAVVKGAIVRDGRTDVFAHTANAALLLNAYLGDRELGLGEANITDDGLFTEAADTTQDDGLFSDAVVTIQDDGLFTDPVVRSDDGGMNTAADVADEQVALAAGGNENRYTVNAVIERSMPPSRVIDELIANMAGRLVYTGGTWRLLAGKFVAPTLTFDEDDLLGEIRWGKGRPRRDLVNGVRGQFISPAHTWRRTDYPAFVSSARRAEDDGEPFWRGTDRPMVTSPATCQRLGKIDVERSHQPITAELALKLTALEARAGEVIKVTNARLGWTDKEFEVETFRLSLTGDSPTIRIDLGVRETVSTIFDWATTEERALFAPLEADVQPLSLQVRLRRTKTVFKDRVAELEQQVTFKLDTLTDLVTIQWDLDKGQVASITLGANRTLANPTNMKNGGTYILHVIQDPTGGRTLAYQNAYRWQGGAAPVLSTAPNAVDIITFTSDGVSMFGVIRQDFQ